MAATRDIGKTVSSMGRGYSSKQMGARERGSGEKAKMFNGNRALSADSSLQRLKARTDVINSGLFTITCNLKEYS